MNLAHTLELHFGYSIRRVNNPTPFADGPEPDYELLDEDGKVVKQFSDKTGAENALAGIQRKKFGLKESKNVKKARYYKEGKKIHWDERLRPTNSAGTGAGLGPGPSNG